MIMSGCISTNSSRLIASGSDVTINCKQPHNNQSELSLAACIKMSDKTKTRVKIARSDQERMLMYFEAHPTMITKAFTGPQSRKLYNEHWKNFSSDFNYRHRTTKTPMQWQRIVSDWIQRVKKRMSAFRQSSRKTGGGPCTQDSLSDLDHRLLQIKGVSSFDGDGSTGEAGFGDCITEEYTGKGTFGDPEFGDDTEDVQWEASENIEPQFDDDYLPLRSASGARADSKTQRTASSFYRTFPRSQGKINMERRPSSSTSAMDDRRNALGKSGSGTEWSREDARFSAVNEKTNDFEKKKEKNVLDSTYTSHARHFEEFENAMSPNLQSNNRYDNSGAGNSWNSEHIRYSDVNEESNDFEKNAKTVRESSNCSTSRAGDFEKYGRNKVSPNRQLNLPTEKAVQCEIPSANAEMVTLLKEMNENIKRLNESVTGIATNVATVVESVNGEEMKKIGSNIAGISDNLFYIWTGVAEFINQPFWKALGSK